MNNRLQEEKKNRISKIFFYGIIPMIILMPITTFLDNWYDEFQMLSFSNDNTLLFLHPGLANLIIFYSPYTLVFLIMFSAISISYIRIMKIKFFSFIAIVIFIISAFILLFQFFECTDINEDGICIRNGIFSTDKNYVWSDVQYVDVSYKGRDKNKIELIYDMHLNDGTIVNACNSKDFFSNIMNLDNFIKNKKIKINRSKIQTSDYKDFQIRYENNELQVLLKIFDK